MNERIKEIRKNLGITQSAFADQLGVSLSNIQSYELGRRIPSDAFIQLICSKLNVNEIWLRTGEGDMFSPISKSEELALITKKLMKDEDPAYREELIKIIADMDIETLKIWYDYAKQWVTNVENRK